MSQQEKLCALSVDLDPLTCYYQIHGLGEPPRRLESTIVRKALPRFEALFAEAGVPATLFVVARELAKSPEAQQTVRRMVGAGHEVGNHTYGHPYDLCQLSAEEIDRELRRAHDVIGETVGAERAPVGFRSPGYFINGAVAGALVRLGYRYDSSMFPSPPYWLAKLAIMAGMRLRGRRSGAVISDPRGLIAPVEPYRPSVDRPWLRGSAPLLELPVAMLPWSRIPAIGTLFAAGPAWLRRHALSSIERLRFFNFELHGIDLADAVRDSIPTELAGRQPDLRIPADEKRLIFLETIRQLQREYRFVTLAEAAERLSRVT